jgi:hypothetical protein
LALTLFYPDVSNNNWGDENLTAAGQQNLNNFLANLQAQGFAGVSHKMSQGSSYIDPYGALCQTWCAQSDFPFIGYHYLDTTNPAAQAQNWLAAGGGSNAMFDWENQGGDLDNFWAVATAFNAVGVNVQLGYCPQWYLESAPGNGAGTDISAFASNGILLVSSGYPDGAANYASNLYAGSGGDTGEGWAPYDGATPSAWQFTSSALISGFNGVDCNAYLGTDLNVLFGTAPAVVPPPPPPPPPVTPPPPPAPPGQAINLFTGAIPTAPWTLPDDDSILTAAGVIVDQLLGVGAAATGASSG